MRYKRLILLQRVALQTLTGLNARISMAQSLFRQFNDSRYCRTQSRDPPAYMLLHTPGLRDSLIVHPNNKTRGNACKTYLFSRLLCLKCRIFGTILEVVWKLCYAWYTGSSNNSSTIYSSSTIAVICIYANFNLVPQNLCSASVPRWGKFTNGHASCKLCGIFST